MTIFSLKLAFSLDKAGHFYAKRSDKILDRLRLQCY